MTTLAATTTPGFTQPSLRPSRFVPLGIAFWVAGVLCARLLAGLGLFAPARAPWLLFATVPVAWLTVRLGARLGVDKASLVSGMALLSAPALLLDGIGLNFTTLYAADPAILFRAGAWLLWFIGATLAFAYAAERGTRRHAR